jgi:hypothetical protein
MSTLQEARDFGNKPNALKGACIFTMHMEVKISRS